MSNSMNLGIALIVIGVLGNNYAYLHDYLWSTTQGYIQLGPKSWTAIVVSLIVIAAGIWRIATPGKEPPGDTEGGSEATDDTQ